MPELDELKAYRDRTFAYLVETLLPFWLGNAHDAGPGGYLTYFDRNGRRTGETDKTFLMQIRMLYTLASAHRAGYGDGACGDLARQGAEFIGEHFWDRDHDGWIWIADRNGRPLSTAKIGYGQAFALYAFSELAMSTGDPVARDWADRTAAAIARHMADTRHGGYHEIMRPDWRPEEPGRRGGDRKSLDVHMHLMEAFTAWYELTGRPTPRRRLVEVIDLVIARMLDPRTGLGWIQFSPAFEPLPAIRFEVEWGRDAPPSDGDARPLDMTSPGHNVEFAWLLLHAADVLGRDRAGYAAVVRPLFDHCVEHGIDREYGGVYADVPMARPPDSHEKQFWQQAEALVGMLDAYALFDDRRYWDAFRNVYGFVFARFVNLDGGGEWYERVDRSGEPLDAAIGHAWKISYHTVRSMIRTVERLDRLIAAVEGG